MLQEDLENRTVSVSVKATKLTAKVLAKMLRAIVNHGKKKYNAPKAGEQSFKRLNRTISGDTADVEVVGRIKSFEQFARKYNVSYHVEKTLGTDPPKWTVFFKANQASNMMAAFKEYSASILEKDKKPSVRAAIRDLGELVKQAVLERGPKVRERNKGGPEL